MNANVQGVCEALNDHKKEIVKPERRIVSWRQKKV